MLGTALTEGMFAMNVTAIPPCTTAVEPLLTHGVTERNHVTTDQEAALEELHRDGFTVIRGAMTPEEVTRAATGMDTLYADQVAEFGIENIRRIRDNYIVRTMLAFDAFFLHRVACNSALLGLIKLVLGPNISLSSQVGILSPPDDRLYQVAWHRE